jgi:putative FmdB family regulatory protein
VLYEYECKNCGHHFEKIVKMANRLDAVNEQCPECGIAAVEQFIGTLRVIENHKLMTRKRPDGQFSERMEKIHLNTPGSTLNNSGYF